MLSWVVLNFIPFIHSNATQLTCSLTGLLAMARRVKWIRFVHPVQTCSWNWLFSFFLGTQDCLRGPYGVVYDRARFFEKNVLPPKWEKLSKPRVLWMYRKVQFFFLVLYFLISVVYNESLYDCNSCMLEQILYLGKFWFLRYGPKCSWPIRLQHFSINRRTLKLAVSQTEINEINWFLVCPSSSFLRNGLLCFCDFWHNGK